MVKYGFLQTTFPRAPVTFEIGFMKRPNPNSASQKRRGRTSPQPLSRRAEMPRSILYINGLKTGAKLFHPSSGRFHSEYFQEQIDCQERGPGGEVPRLVRLRPQKRKRRELLQKP